MPSKSLYMIKKTKNKEKPTFTLKRPHGVNSSLLGRIVKLIGLDTFLYRQIGKEMRKQQLDFIAKNRDNYSIKELANDFNCTERNISKKLVELKASKRL